MNKKQHREIKQQNLSDYDLDESHLNYVFDMVVERLTELSNDTDADGRKHWHTLVVSPSGITLSKSEVANVYGEKPERLEYADQLFDPR